MAQNYYMFREIDIKFNIMTTTKNGISLLRQKSVLVHGRGFNWQAPDHFRIVTLPYVHQIEEML